ncbi:YheC/YheD family protein [Paenibacillus psychroresistens]|uniref:YheC/YheD family protein n=1 Tax=Paenibacillus psychroresistens TaxID=1778678 RepID=A0A6B8RH41_9BACL|nr:YheC/YheD family protein [Paenibacillus psychroresistens]QGQ94915.1 YheC/YheD family protein [Paenibacillus psychroresistens]
MMIGVLYPESLLNQLIRKKFSYEKPDFYVEAARKTGSEIIFFCLSDISWKKGTVKSWNGAEAELVKRELPPVIINRTRTNSPLHKKWIQRLKARGKIIFNEHNVISKLKIHHILSKNNKLLPYLPVTDSVTHQSVSELIEQNPCLFLKPRSASVGNGIIRISRNNQDMVAEVNILGQTKRHKVGIDQIINLIKSKKRSYLVQQGISLMEYEGNPVDFRVSIQKDGKGRWHYTGMVGKVAKKGAIVTNLHCGGHSIKVSELFRNWGWKGVEIERKVSKLGILIAQTLDQELPHIADLGLDIAIDEHQHPWLIEANFRDLRITFRDAGEKDKWRATFATPVYYAAHLIKKLKEQENRDLLKQNELKISAVPAADIIIPNSSIVIKE